MWDMPSAGTGRTAYLASASSDSTDLTMDLRPTAVATGGGIYLTVLGRWINANTDVHTNIKLTNSAKVQVSLGAFQGSGSENRLTSTVTLPGTLGAADEIHVRMQTFGTSPTTVRTKVWIGSDPEPSAWTVSATASASVLQVPGGVGLTSYVSGSATVLPADLHLLDVVARPVA